MLDALVDAPAYDRRLLERARPHLVTAEPFGLSVWLVAEKPSA